MYPDQTYSVPSASSNAYIELQSSPNNIDISILRSPGQVETSDRRYDNLSRASSISREATDAKLLSTQDQMPNLSWIPYYPHGGEKPWPQSSVSSACACLFDFRTDQ
jgi:hypothetical protein